MLSARNQLPATVKSVRLGNVMAEVVMNVGDVELVAAITRRLGRTIGAKGRRFSQGSDQGNGGPDR